MRLYMQSKILMVLALSSALGFAQTHSATKKFELQSSSWQQGSTIAAKNVFNGFGCSGQNISPALAWSGAPAGTQSFALTMYDPDAPTGSGWWHWVVFNIPSTVKALPEGAGNQAEILPGTSAVQSLTDFGKPGYGGPCPPVGDKPHRYTVTIYALKAPSLPLDSKSPGAMVGYYIHQNMIGSASMTANYGR